MQICKHKTSKFKNIPKYCSALLYIYISMYQYIYSCIFVYTVYTVYTYIYKLKNILKTLAKTQWNIQTEFR